MPHNSNRHCYEFDSYKVDVDQRVLTRAGKAVPLTPKATDILLVLLKNAGQLVEKEALMNEVWPDTFVEDANLTQNIFTLRRALGDVKFGPRYIETVARRGYRFIADVVSQVENGAEAKVPNLPADTSHFHTPPIIAVVPFSNATGNNQLEYLSAGITDNLTNNLARTDKLRIVSRSGVFRYHKNKLDPLELGRSLGVDAVLSGELTEHGGLGVRAELVEVNNGWLLWSETFDLSTQNILEVQDEIAKQISSTLRLKLTGEEEGRITTRYTESSAAYQSYLEGRYHWSRYTKAGIEKAIKHFGDAIELDPNYALAYSGIVDCYLRLATNYLPPNETLSDYALSLDQSASKISWDSGESRDRLRLRYEWDCKEAERALRRANDLKSNYLAVHQWRFAFFDSVALLQECVNTESTSMLSKVLKKSKDFRLEIEPTGGEQTQILCAIAREQIQIGNYEASRLLLRRWWDCGKWPETDHLNIQESADLLFTAGTLASCLSSTGSVSLGQKHAETLLSGALAFYEFLGVKIRAAEARIELGRCYYREGLFDLARSMLTKALEATKDSDPELRGISLVLLGVIERDAGRFRDSFIRLTEAEKTLGSSNPLVAGRYHHEIATTLKELAISSFSDEYANQARKHFDRALYALEAIGNHRHIAAAENNLGYLLLNLGQTAACERHLLRAKRLFDSFSDLIRSAQVDDTLAHLYLGKGELLRAAETIHSAIKTFESTDEGALLAEALITQGIIMSKLKRVREAKKSLEDSYRVAERCANHEAAGRALLIMTEELSGHLSAEERIVISKELRKLMVISQQASIVTRLQQTLATLNESDI